jgi:hypothetical protein
MWGGDIDLSNLDARNPAFNILQPKRVAIRQLQELLA